MKTRDTVSIHRARDAVACSLDTIFHSSHSYCYDLQLILYSSHFFYLLFFLCLFFFFFFFNDTATTEIYTLSLHDALPICPCSRHALCWRAGAGLKPRFTSTCCRSEEHTSELQSHSDLVCRLLLEKKKKKIR